MKRKVVLHGPSTLTISLPSSWVKKFSISKGEELDVQEEYNSLVISTDKDIQRVKKIELDVKGLGNADLFWKILCLFHKSGYDEIKITTDNSKTIKIAQEKISTMLLGYEIIEQGEQNFVIKNIATEEASAFDNILRRVFLILLNFSESSLEALKKDNTQLNKLLILEQTINKLTNLCQRMLNKGQYNAEYPTFLYVLVWTLESIGDHYRDICNQFNDQKKLKLSPAILDSYEKTNALIRKYYEIFYKFDVNQLKSLYDEEKKLYKLLYTFFTKNIKEDEKIIIYHLMQITKRIDDLYGSTLGLHLQEISSQPT